MMKLPKILLGTSVLIFATMSQANDLTQANQIQSKTNQLSVVSQQKINSDANVSLDLKNQLTQLREELRNLNIYRDHLETLVSSQQKEQLSLQDQIEQIKQTRQGIVPLMYQMLTSLEVIIKSDKPIKLEQRLSRLDDLKKMMGRADVSDAEKYHRILEAFQIEMDYGKKLTVYRDEIMTQTNQLLDVEIVAIGRLALIARTFDHQHFWYWDVNDAAWIDGDLSSLADINHTFDVAQKRVPPTLLTLPVSLIAVGNE